MENLEKRAKEIRKKFIDLLMKEKEGHPGGSLSEIEILIALFNIIMKKEDKFILSKGHSCYPLYLLLQEKGFNPKIKPHPDIDLENGIYCTSGSLGHGFPMALGMALARKLKGKQGKIFVLIGDGECQEGTTWESALIASHHNLNNLVVIVDNNKLQALDKINNIISLGNLKEKFQSFSFHVEEINGHSFSELIESLEKNPEKPYVIIANTTKGKGISYMENDPKWHTRLPTEEELKIAYKELS